jgi:uncharacterized protein with FMN-binding domain
MKRVILAVVSTVASLVMLLSFKTHAAAPAAIPPAAISSTGSTTTSTSASASSSTSSSTATKTVTGSAVDTRFGPVQVQITVTNGKITAATAVDYPNGNPRDAQINAYAIPTLNSEAVQAGSASIDMVSGATYTSEGYLQSLQSALDKV